MTIEWFAGHSVAQLSATPARLGAALGVRIDDYRSPQGQRFYSAVKQPSTPAALAQEVTGLGRVTDYADVHDDYVPAAGLSPTGLMEAYDATPLRAAGMNGTGETIVAFEIDGYTQSDLNTFTTKFNLPAFNSSNFTVNGGEAGPAEGESNMDLETLRGIAPQAKIVYYNLYQDTSARSFSQLLVAGFSAAAKDYPGSVWTLSLSGCEKASDFTDLNSENTVAVAAEGKGTTIFASSGDTGGFECTNNQDWGSSPTSADIGVANPAVLPAVTGVGGTRLSVTTTGAYYGETTWYYPIGGGGTSGGVSTMIAQPSWQTGQGLPTPSDKVPRQVPDVSAVGDPITGTENRSGGSWIYGGGTSLSTPIWAGFTALMDEYLQKNGKGAIGPINGLLYYLADHTQKYPPFHMVTTGGNNVWRNGVGYNQSTGLGSPDVYNLARDILAFAKDH